jgi:hypothetical protein
LTGHSHEHSHPVESNLGPLGDKLRSGALGIALLGLLVAIGFTAYAVNTGHDDGIRRFSLAYLAAFGFALSLGLGGLFFVFIQHLTRAGWSVLVRRLAEAMASNFLVLAILFVPIAGSVLWGNGMLYPWAQPLSATVIHHKPRVPLLTPEIAGAIAPAAPATAAEDKSHGKPAASAADKSHDTTKAAVAIDDAAEDAGHSRIRYAGGVAGHEPDHHHHPHKTLDALTLKKRSWLNPEFFVVRWIAYFVIWGFLGWYFWKNSVKQDGSGDPLLTRKMEKLAAPAAFVFGLTLTFASWDLLMSLNPHWFSTIFGVYYFAGSVIATMATLILLVVGLQKAGVLTKEINVEHRHDLGKLMFAFTFFWGYIAFSQYMLLWYASLPETTGWLSDRGATTVTEQLTPWCTVAIVLLFGHFLIPFPCLLSRHVKRHPLALPFFACWMLVMHAVDMWWIVMPELGPEKIAIGPIEFGLMAFVVGSFFAGVFHRLTKQSLVPTHDPRVSESLAFQNL